MNEKERISAQSREKESNQEQLDEIAAEQREAMRDQLERQERKQEVIESEDEVLHRAERLAQKAEIEKTEHSKDTPLNEKYRGAPSRKQLHDSFKQQMQSVRENLGIGGKVFSTIIHNKTIESVSNFLSVTIARPNALLSGSIAAFVTVTILYFVAKHYGFQLSGFETILAFILGWLIGIIYDYSISRFRK